MAIHDYRNLYLHSAFGDIETLCIFRACKLEKMHLFGFVFYFFFKFHFTLKLIFYREILLADHKKVDGFIIIYCCISPQYKLTGKGGSENKPRAEDNQGKGGC